MDPVLTPYIREANSHTLDHYIQKSGGYGALKHAGSLGGMMQHNDGTPRVVAIGQWT